MQKMALGLAVKTTKRQKMQRKRHEIFAFSQKTGAFQTLSV